MFPTGAGAQTNPWCLIKGRKAFGISFKPFLLTRLRDAAAAVFWILAAPSVQGASAFIFLPRWRALTPLPGNISLIAFVFKEPKIVDFPCAVFMVPAV